MESATSPKFGPIREVLAFTYCTYQNRVTKTVECAETTEFANRTPMVLLVENTPLYMFKKLVELGRIREHTLQLRRDGVLMSHVITCDGLKDSLVANRHERVTTTLHNIWTNADEQTFGKMWLKYTLPDVSKLLSSHLLKDSEWMDLRTDSIVDEMFDAAGGKWSYAAGRGWWAS